MTITADSKKRVVIPSVRPGEVVTCEQRDENHFPLARLQLPPLLKKKSREVVRGALKKQPAEV